MKKGLFTAAVFLTLLFTTVSLAEDSISILINQIPVTTEQPPMIENDRTLVPFRAVAEALHAEVSWDESTRTVRAVRGRDTVTLQIDSKLAQVNSQEKMLDVPARIIENRTFIPLRFFAEGMRCRVSWDEGSRTIRINPLMTVHYLDVGQADSILVESPEGRVMLIDAGNNADGPFVVQYLKDHSIGFLDILVGTHPHEDHIGGLDDVILNFSVGSLYLPDASANTKTYRDVMDAITQKGYSVTTAKAGIQLDFADESKMLAPISARYQDVNDYSAVIRTKYGTRSFLFTGDAEATSEKEILASGADLSADVLKVGHHGSASSTSAAFLQLVHPQYAVISVGAKNTYGHPTQAVLDRLGEIGAAIYRTDKNGTVVITSDGSDLSVEPQHE